jgi:hypothetical protein
MRKKTAEDVLNMVNSLRDEVKHYSLNQQAIDDKIALIREDLNKKFHHLLTAVETRRLQQQQLLQQQQMEEQTFLRQQHQQQRDEAKRSFEQMQEHFKQGGNYLSSPSTNVSRRSSSVGLNGNNNSSNNNGVTSPSKRPTSAMVLPQRGVLQASPSMSSSGLTGRKRISIAPNPIVLGSTPGNNYKEEESLIYYQEDENIPKMARSRRTHSC